MRRGAKGAILILLLPVGLPFQFRPVTGSAVDLIKRSALLNGRGAKGRHGVQGCFGCAQGVSQGAKGRGRHRARCPAGRGPWQPGQQTYQSEESEQALFRRRA